MRDKKEKFNNFSDKISELKVLLKDKLDKKNKYEVSVTAEFKLVTEAESPELASESAKNDVTFMMDRDDIATKLNGNLKAKLLSLSKVKSRKIKVHGIRKEV